MYPLPPNEKIALHLMSYHETGSWHLDYAKVAYSSNDPGGLSVGWGQAALTTSESTLTKMMDAYLAAQGIYADELRKYIEPLRAWDKPTQASSKVHDLFKVMAQDPVWQGIQDRAFTSYMDRARERLAQRGMTSHVAFAFWVDMEIQHGRDWLADRALKAIRGEGPKAYQDLLRQGATDYYGGEWGGQEEYDESCEQDVLWATILCRLDFLMTEAPSPEAGRSWPPSTYRCAHLAWLAENGPEVWDWGMQVQTVHPQNRLWEVTQGLLVK